MPVRQLIRRLVAPAPGTTRRIPVGPARGVTFAAEPAETASADMWVGLFESEIAPYVRRFARPGVTSVDVGTNSGYYALTFAARCRAPVLAYEPDPAARERLARNLALNPSVAPFVDLHASAVGDVPGDGIVRLDDELADGAAIRPVGLLKVDVDGPEVEVLAGARRLLAERRPQVIVETHSPELERDCARLLAEAGYRSRVVAPRRLLAQDRPGTHNRWLIAGSRVDGTERRGHLGRHA
jgi:hypothetical protein